ncbi:MAG TPA: aminotransferase class V-fold PLP-dependent enzyme [Gemmatimonadaceae bacterium]|nr:aminotransferase class V-fold PLP-dependent enzyme [Gemmatimonadaceae bacterium]
MTALSRRDFARFLAFTGSAALIPERAFAERTRTLEEWGLTNAPLPPTPAEPDEKFWHEVRSRFLIPRDLGFLNAANLCPTSLPAIEALERNVRAYEANPSPEVRSELMKGREEARKLLAEALRVTPEEIVLTRNTTEGNNFVSSGIPLGAGDEVVVWADNHPSNLRAWTEKAKRFGFTVVTVPVVSPHPGADGYVALFTKAMTPRTRVLAFSHVSSNSGDLLPAAELCKLARERGAFSLVDGAQTFGVLDLDLAAMQPDFFTGSMHKWPCGPKEKGLFYVNKTVHDRIFPSVYGVYAGAVGISRQFEGEGQRDDASIAAVVEGLKFQGTIGRAMIEKRSRALAQHLVTELGKLDGITMWTHTDPALSSAIVIFRPGALDPRRLGAALTQKERIVCTVRASQDRPGLRVSPHFYNTMDEMDRTVGAIRKYLASGV